MDTHSLRGRPEPWAEKLESIRTKWLTPFFWVEHGLEWVAYCLSQWRFLEVLWYLERFGVLIAVIFYFGESGDRVKQKHYQAWQVINSAAGKGGNGGRIEALEELNADGVSLVGVDLASAFLQGVQLKGASLGRATLDGADARDSDWSGADMRDASLRSANFRSAKLDNVELAGSVLDEGDFAGARLQGADLAGASLENVDMHGADLQGVKWKGVRKVNGANVLGVRNADGFVTWAMEHGAVKRESE